MKVCVNFEADFNFDGTGDRAGAQAVTSDSAFAREQMQKNIAGIVDFVLAKEAAKGFKELSVTLVEEDEIARLNEEFRGKPSSTDVLSFPCDDEIMGDVVICPQVAARQCAEFGNTTEEEIYQLLIHGLLHLLGYDHIDDKDYEIMRLREAEIWRAFSVERI